MYTKYFIDMKIKSHHIPLRALQATFSSYQVILWYFDIIKMYYGCNMDIEIDWLQFESAIDIWSIPWYIFLSTNWQKNIKR